ncbi:histone H1 [Candidatus Sumerlaeota bacterium]|nr:histone H1 [Candidatus Sumerlaeota bacterium]
MAKTLKRPRDPNQLAKLIGDLATGQAYEPPMLSDEKKIAAGQRGGLKGGKARAEKLTAEERSSIARKAANAKWHPEEQ